MMKLSAALPLVAMLILLLAGGAETAIAQGNSGQSNGSGNGQGGGQDNGQDSGNGNGSDNGQGGSAGNGQGNGSEGNHPDGSQGNGGGNAGGNGPENNNGSGVGSASGNIGSKPAPAAQNAAPASRPRGVNAAPSPVVIEVPRDAVQQGRALPFDQIAAAALAQEAGTIIDARLLNANGLLVYELKMLRPKGDVELVYYYAGSGRRVR